MRLPKSSTVTRSAIPITNAMSCSTSSTEIPSSCRASAIARAIAIDSSCTIPATGSSSNSRPGSAHSARASSTRLRVP